MSQAIMGYFGSKHRIAERLIKLMPPHRGYVELYADWFRIDLSAWTGQGNRAAARTEVVWSNRALPQAPA